MVRHLEVGIDETVFIAATGSTGQRAAEIDHAAADFPTAHDDGLSGGDPFRRQS